MPTVQPELKPIEQLGIGKVVSTRAAAHSPAHGVVRSSDWNRRRMGALGMALVGMATLTVRRFDYDNVWVMLAEAIVGGLVIAWAGRIIGNARSLNRPTNHSAYRSIERFAPQTAMAVALAIISPWLIDLIARGMGYGNGMEIMMLASLGWGAMAAAVTARIAKTISISVICSGFLAMFSTFIADSSWAGWLAYLWIAMCLWWLTANHWERVELTDATSVQHLQRSHLIYLVLGIVVFGLGTWLIGDRVPVLRKLSAELMPTSGGTGKYDAAARRGVGNGDALVAAKDHATSFGPVETDFFLDSEKPSLFDVMSDEFGEPKTKSRFERAEALSPQETRTQEGKFAETNRASGGQFTTDRIPPRQTKTPKDLVADSLMFWEGAAGAHLAVERFDAFDGVAWHRTVEAERKQPESIEIDERTWFKPPYSPLEGSSAESSPFVGAIPEALKFTRFRSATIPTRVGLQLWSIDQLTRADFFEYSQDECLSMPGREHVPDYTVVRFVDSQLDLERLEQMLHYRYQNSPSGTGTTVLPGIRELAAKLSQGKTRGWAQVQAIVQGLRKDFALEAVPMQPRDDGDAKQSTTPLARFLETRRGPSYLFATAASEMLESCGYETRLVAGFYASPKHFLASEGEYAIQPSDAHVWLEIHAGNGVWVPLEPTPGYRQPPYFASWWYRVKQARTEIFLWSVALLLTTSLFYLFRVYILEVLCRIVSPAIELIPDRRRIVWLGRLLDFRLRMLGYSRPVGRVPREHLAPLLEALPASYSQPMRGFLDACDAIRFGPVQQLTPNQRQVLRRVWNEFHCFRLQRALKVVRPSGQATC